MGRQNLARAAMNEFPPPGIEILVNGVAQQIMREFECTIFFQQDVALDQFIHIMDDDLNTAGAIGFLFEKIKEFNRIMDSCDQKLDEATIHGLKKDRRDFLTAAWTLGLLGTSPSDFLDELSSPSEKANQKEIEALIDQRTKARMKKDWAQADAIRDRLKEMGVLLEDTPKGTTWRYHV